MPAARPAHRRFVQATEPWRGGFRVQLTEPQVHALLALDARDGGRDPGPTRSLGTWRALRDFGLVRWPHNPDDRPSWARIAVTKPGASVLELLSMAGRKLDDFAAT